MITPPLADQTRFKPYVIVSFATTLIGALGSSLGGPIASIIGAIVGLGWGIGFGFLSAWLSRRWPNISRRWLFMGAFIAATLFGGSLFAMLLYVASPTSENIHALMRPPWKGGFTFFVIFNSLMEWLVIPLAVFLNWQHTRRRSLLIACGVLFYLSRVWTYIYFVPQIFQFMRIPATEPISVDVANGVLKWVNLSWIRCAIDGVVAILFLRAASTREEIPGV
jgi:hypothetical protein